MALRNTNDLIRRSGYSDHWEMKKQILMTALFLWAIPLFPPIRCLWGRNFPAIMLRSVHQLEKEVSDMDTKMIGSFLKELRKENNMTQEQLGERIGVTNKTVSRWETGNYMPPVESLILLSDIYGISINEILAGKRVEMDELKEVADDNVTKVLGELEGDYKKFEKRMIVILIINAILAISIITLMPLKSAKDVAIFVMVLVMAFLSNVVNMVAVGAKKESIR